MSQAPGWYTDPFIHDQERYWDGRVWTQGTQPDGTTAADAEGQPGADAAAPTPTFAPLGAPGAAGRGRARRRVLRRSIAGEGFGARGRRNSRRLAVLGIGAAALLLIGAGVSAALVLGGPNNASAASEAVTTAATQTINAQSADMSMSMDMSIMGTQESITANGAFDFAQHTGTLTMNIPAGGKQLTEQAIYDGSTVYVNIGGLLGGLTQGKQWVSADIGQLESGASGLGGMNTFGDPAAMLQQLQSIGGTVTSLGPTTYDGTSVTEYSVSIPPSALKGEIGQLPSSLQQGLSGVTLPDIKADVYITPDNLLKAMYMPMSFSADGQSMSMDMTMSFSNYGTPVTVTPPPASQVLPLSQLGGALGWCAGRPRRWEHGDDRRHGQQRPLRELGRSLLRPPSVGGRPPPPDRAGRAVLRLRRTPRGGAP